MKRRFHKVVGSFFHQNLILVLSDRLWHWKNTCVWWSHILLSHRKYLDVWLCECWKCFRQCTEGLNPPSPCSIDNQDFPENITPLKYQIIHKNKLFSQSYFSIFRRLKKTILRALFVNNTFISNTWLRFNSKQ